MRLGLWMTTTVQGFAPLGMAIGGNAIRLGWWEESFGWGRWVDHRRSFLERSRWRSLNMARSVRVYECTSACVVIHPAP
ncbi:hypothetical protein BJV77DRAFT_1030500 [Russula vinacea]|nr:hypothetical protein BJV77DRAFT_1030500 [Russula vinacea]